MGQSQEHNQRRADLAAVLRPNQPPDSIEPHQASAYWALRYIATLLDGLAAIPTPPDQLHARTVAMKVVVGFLSDARQAIITSAHEFRP